MAEYADIITNQRERYVLNWVGRGESLIEAGKPLDPPKTLRPNLDESVDFDKTKNLFITGDNLEALKLLQESYMGKVDMIYIDPPYNTGSDFVYHDNFAKSQSEEIDDSRDEDGNRQFTVNKQESGRYHSDWLSMMYPRLMLARNFLSDKGVIFISIDDNEQANLKLLCDEVFGSRNFVANFIWHKKTQPSFLSHEVANVTEYITCYKKGGALSLFGGFTDATKPIELINISNQFCERVLSASSVKFPNENNVTLYPGEYGNESLSIKLMNKVDIVDSIPTNDIRLVGRFKWSQEKIDSEIADGAVIYIKSTKSLRPTIVRTNGQTYIKPPISLLSKAINNSATNTDASNELKKMFNGVTIFTNPKPSRLIQKLLCMATNKNKDSLIMDFFAGSGTTAHAVMKLNAEDGGHRNFILVQLPEECNDKSEAYKAGYQTIDQLSRERIRRAAKQIAADDPHADQHDYGCRALTIDDANENSDIAKTAESTSQDQLGLLIDNIRSGRTPLDLLFGALLAKGWQLDGEIENLNIGNNNVISYDRLDGMAGTGILACFDDVINDETIHQIIDMAPQIAIFRDSSFKTSADKINLAEQFKSLSHDGLMTKVWVI